MRDRFTRRTFLSLTGGAAAAVSSSNGLCAVNRATELVRGGADTLDAAVEGVKIKELGPELDSVGYGALPHEDGVGQLDVPDGESMVTRRPTGTINLDVVNAHGDVSSGTTFYSAKYAAHEGKNGALRDTAHLHERPN